MAKTFDVEKAIQAQQEYRKEYAEKHPRDWASSMIKRGEGFAPWMNAVTAANDHSNPTKSKARWQKKEGISVERARTELTTGCPFCYRSFVD